MQQTKDLCDTVLTIQRDLRLTYEQAETISREVGNAIDATRRNSQLWAELEKVKRVANDQAQLAAQLKAIVLHLHNAATCDTPLDEGYKLLAVQEVFNSYPMRAEWLGEAE